jgi:hypothetical protein
VGRDRFVSDLRFLGRVRSDGYSSNAHQRIWQEVSAT